MPLWPPAFIDRSQQRQNQNLNLLILLLMLYMSFLASVMHFLIYGSATLPSPTLPNLTENLNAHI